MLQYVMIINKLFDYKPLERVDTPAGRRYSVNDKALPSVTTILDAVSDKTHLVEWVNSIGEERANKIKNEASSLGTEIHTNLENYIFGKAISGSFMARALSTTLIKKALINVNEVWGSEIALHYKDLYAGTTDLVGVFKNSTAIMDFKNSTREKKKEWIESYFLQLSAYAIAHDEMYNTNIQSGVIMLVTRDSKYQEFVIEGQEFMDYKCKWSEKVTEYYNMIGSDK